MMLHRLGRSLERVTEFIGVEIQFRFRQIICVPDVERRAHKSPRNVHHATRERIRKCIANIPILHDFTGQAQPWCATPLRWE